MNFPPNTEKHTSEISGRGGEDGAAPDRQGVCCWVGRPTTTPSPATTSEAIRPKAKSVLWSECRWSIREKRSRDSTYKVIIYVECGEASRKMRAPPGDTSASTVIAHVSDVHVVPATSERFLLCGEPRYRPRIEGLFRWSRIG